MRAALMFRLNRRLGPVSGCRNFTALQIGGQRRTLQVFFLRAFGIPGTAHNVLLVQVSQSLATIFPFSPAGIGTEQALLLYIFRGVASRTSVLSFSVGLRITLIVLNATLGFSAILITLRTLRYREVVEADRTAVPTTKGQTPGGV